MWGLHLKQKGRWWHYYRAVPREFGDVEKRDLISFSLKTGDFTEAKRRAAQISAEMEQDWRDAKARSVSLCAQDAAERYRAAAVVQLQSGFASKTSREFSDADLLDRLRCLIDGSHSQPEQKAVLGLVEQPELSLADAFDRFWRYIQDEWMQVSHDQQRVKRNVYLKAMRNFETAVGVVPFHQVERSHAVAFRGWWVERLKAKGLKPYTGNREINSLRRMFSVNFDIDGQSMPNPFSGVRLKETAEVARIPLSTEQIQALLKAGVLDPLHEDFQRLFHLLINTGMRPVEAIGLELDDVNLVRDVWIQKNRSRKQDGDQISQHISSLEQRQASLLDKIASCKSAIVQEKLESQIEELEDTIKATRKQLRSTGIREDEIDAYFGIAKNLMEHPTKHVMNAPTKEKTEKLWSFIFQERPTYQDLVDGTPELTLIYRLNRDIGADKIQLAGHLSNGWNPFEMQFRTGLEVDLSLGCYPEAESLLNSQVITGALAFSSAF